MVASLDSERVDFSASYSDKQIREHARFKLLILTNPIGWMIGACYLINELFKNIVIKCGQDVIFGCKEERKIRDAELIENIRSGMGGQKLRLGTPDGRSMEAMYVPALNNLAEHQHKTVLLFTGSHRSYEFYAVPMVKAYREQGFHVLCVNYGGFGDSEGHPSESTINLDAETAYQYIQRRFPESEIYAHGYSLGSYPATYLSKHYELKKAVVDRGFSAISTVIKEKADEMCGKTVGYVLKCLSDYAVPLNNINNIEKGRCQVLCARADYDTMMSRTHVDQIYEHCASKVTILDFHGYHHHDQNSVWFQENEQFWNWIRQG